MSHSCIDQAAKNDLPQLVALLRELFSIERDFTPDTGRQAAGLRLLLGDPRAAVFVARGPHGEPIGMATAQLVVSTAEGALSAWVEDVIVAKDHRGRGLGRALVKAALNWASGQGATRAQLLVDVHNTAALHFYEKLGWDTTSLSARRISLQRRGL